jgi:cell division protease FtsH
LQALAPLRQRAGVAFADWRRRWRRSRVAHSRLRSRKVYVLSLTLAGVSVVFAVCMTFLSSTPPGQQITLDAYTGLAADRLLVSATFLDEEARVTGTFTCPAPNGNASLPGALRSACESRLRLAADVLPNRLPAPDNRMATSPSRVSFWLAYPKTDAETAVLIQLATDAHAVVRVDPQTGKASVRVVTLYILPLAFLATLFGLLFASGQAGSAGIGAVEMFGSIGSKSRFGRRRKHAPITFADVAGADEAIEELKEVRDYLADPARYTEIGASPPKGVLLIGPPGCGKTLLAKAVAGEVGVPFFSVAGAEFVESLVGVGAARVRDLFRRVRAVAPAIVFIDELDAAGRKRGAGGASGGSDEREQTLNQLLVEMDGFDVSSGIVVMGATNRPDILDPALLRPGRFDRQVTIERPDLDGRARILELHAHGKPLSYDVDLGYLARRTPGFSGADLANVVNEAALLAVRAGRTEIGTGELEEAVARTLTGTVRKGRVLTEEERKRAAYHEAGHVVAAAATGTVGEVHRVSILARGHTLGTASIRADSESALLTLSQLTDRLVVHVAGAAAEELVLGEASTGSERDFQQATALARDIVARYGLSPAVGRMRLLAKDVDAFLDGDVPLEAISGVAHQRLEEEMSRLLADAEAEAHRLLGAHRESLDALANRLETEETIEGPELDAMLALVRPEIELTGLFTPKAKSNGSSNGHKPVSVGRGT